MSSRSQKLKLTRQLAKLTRQSQTEDLKLLKRVKQCNVSKASALLVHALHGPEHFPSDNEVLLPAPAAWVNPPL